ncbi:DNA-binding transcriptional LysR family regulator [Sporomusaceae bacterium BoRhaA]|uniref:LysR family transcriptional regulator n=1 Tax=Pelorhabdus rhamnosifermentans TaxID=2772457 RepID=UPI001C062EE1|nr:LysR family transcriptional regulator [Pelorhabdus rhamnosifermentans]MBU2699443.1 DNA-binding transcriptional LysR family regulator [Pelorhabdus rhamnosifermentans]
MDVEQMEYILEVLKNGNISNTAKKLYMSQPLLSQKIQAVERELNTRIFNRHTSPISLTFAGKIIVDSIKKILDVRDNLLLEIDEINGETRGCMKIAIAPHRAASLLPKVLPVYLAAWPLVEVEIIEDTKGTLSEAVINEQADLAFVRTENKNDALEYVYLNKDNIILFGGLETDLAKRIPQGSTISLQEAKNEKFVSVYEGYGFRKTQEELFKNFNINPKIILETHSIELACRLAISCNFVSLYPGTLHDETTVIKEKSFFCYIERRERAHNFYLCHRKDAYIPKFMRDFIKMAQIIYDG